MVIFWAITPLQSGIFPTVQQTISRPAAVHSIYPLLPVEEHASKLDLGFVSSAYGITWLEGPLPEFTTREYALEPFYLDSEPTASTGNDTWTLPTMSYTTELDCTTAHVSVGRDGRYVYANDKGCSVTGIGFQGPQLGGHLFQYVGYQDGAQTDYALSITGNCSKASFHDFLAVWAAEDMGPSGKLETLEPTALFCETRYYSQSVNASVSSSNLSVIRTTPTGPKLILPEDQFNSTTFEYFLNVGVSPLSDDKDFPDSSTLDLYPRLNDSGLEWPLNPMVAFAMGLQGATIDQYSNPEILHQAFESAHKLLFALAIHELRGPAANNFPIAAGTLESSVKTIVVIRIFAIIVEALLGLVALGSSILIFLYWRRPSNLCKDPASISDVLEIAASSRSNLEDFQAIGNAGTSILEGRMTGKHYRMAISQARENTEPEPMLVRVLVENFDRGHSEHIQPREDIAGAEDAVLPYELSWCFGVPFITTLLASIILILILNVKIRESNGKCSYSLRISCQ